MPHAPLTPCAEPRCPTLVTKGRCALHRRQVEQRRGSAYSRGYTKRWQAYRATWLSHYPLCGDGLTGTQDSQCKAQGRVAAAKDVDHIQRVQGEDDPRFYDPMNHQSLCHACHSAKTQRENEGMGGEKSSRSARRETGPRPSRYMHDLKRFQGAQG